MAFCSCIRAFLLFNCRVILGSSQPRNHGAFYWVSTMPDLRTQIIAAYLDAAAQAREQGNDRQAEWCEKVAEQYGYASGVSDANS